VIALRWRRNTYRLVAVVLNLDAIVVLWRASSGSGRVVWFEERFLAVGCALTLDAQQHAQRRADGDGNEDEIQQE